MAGYRIIIGATVREDSGPSSSTTWL